MITTDINFPADLPCALREGYDINHVQPFLRTTMESGRARQRRRFTSVPSIVNVSWIFNSTQAAFFEAWFRGAIDFGAGWFNTNLRTPLGEQAIVCRFTEMYQGPQLIGRDSWRFNATLEMFEAPGLDPDWVLLPDYLTQADIFDIAINRIWPRA